MKLIYFLISITLTGQGLPVLAQGLIDPTVAAHKYIQGDTNAATLTELIGESPGGFREHLEPVLQVILQEDLPKDRKILLINGIEIEMRKLAKNQSIEIEEIDTWAAPGFAVIGGVIGGASSVLIAVLTSGGLEPAGSAIVAGAMLGGVIGAVITPVKIDELKGRQVKTGDFERLQEVCETILTRAL